MEASRKIIYSRRNKCDVSDIQNSVNSSIFYLALRLQNTVMFEEVMNSKDISVFFKLGKFCKETLAIFKVIHSNA